MSTLSGIYKIPMQMAGALVLAAILFTPVKGYGQNLPPLARDLNPSETALILVDF